MNGYDWFSRLGGVVASSRYFFYNVTVMATVNHCIGLRNESSNTIFSILELAKAIQLNATKIDLSGHVIVQLFFEPSTRTRLSFEMATHQCNATPMMIDIHTSSLTKGESLLDMVKNIEAMGAHAMIVRHSEGGVPHFISEVVSIPVINAGDGYHEHPSQGLLDVFTMHEYLGDLSGKHVLILGDIMHSRVAKSNIWALKHCGATITVAGPPTLVPAVVSEFGVNVCTSIDDILPTVDAVNVLRIQFERQHGIDLPPVQSYRLAYGMTPQREALLPDHAIILHPGPMNRGVELDSSVADGHRTVILKQVQNGVYVRMAILANLLGGVQ